VYTAMTPAELTEQPGEYTLVVQATNTWDEQERCVLLRRTVTVTQIELQYIILGALLGLAILTVGALLGYQIRAHKDAAKRFVESFFKHEGQLAVKICWDLGVRPSPHALPRA
jgi:hypothetical protein